ncbi:MAG: HAMP domain-containing sensor histidine kinase [Anaerolineales bacterium]
MFKNLSRRLGWKLFLSYLVVILVGVVVLATAAELAVPAAFDRHMGGMMGESDGLGMMNQMDPGLFTSFRTAFNEVLFLATLAAVLAAGVVSYFVTRQVVAPVQAMTQASQRIAEGNYAERVPVQAQPGHEDELASLALSFNQMATRLERTEAMRRQLIGDVAHELRTPLTTIKGSMEALLDGALPADETTFEQVYREADRLQRLVHDLQELSRVEARAYELSPVPVEVKSLVQRVASRLKPQFDEKEVSLHVACSPDVSSVMADEDRLTQVLTNLLGNALQYTPAGGKVSVQCSVVSNQSLSRHLTTSSDMKLKPDTSTRGRRSPLSAGNWLLIAVKDTGVGIPPEHLPHVFDRFYRVDKSRSRAGGGSGIGLTIARHLIEAHGGNIWAESEGKGAGSQFSFALPMVSAP